MTNTIIANQIRNRRRARVRAKVFGTAARPRLNVFRSLKHVYAQLIDDEAGKTIVAAHDTELKEKADKTNRAMKVGALLSQKAIKLGIKKVVFDRASYRYHGRVKAVAEGARKGGLEF